MASAFGETIRRLRRDRGLSLDELAKATGSSKSWLWGLETRETSRPSADKVSRLAEALGVTSDYLIAATNADPTADVLDQAFFRRYARLDPETKSKLRNLVDIWSREE